MFWDYLLKLKWGPELAFAAHFQHDFFVKMFLFNIHIYIYILHQMTMVQCHAFSPSQDIKQNVFLTSYLDNR